VIVAALILAAMLFDALLFPGPAASPPLGLRVCRWGGCADSLGASLEELR
jgi:hypothetical protein